jgi:hypothetical protein
VSRAETIAWQKAFNPFAVIDDLKHTIASVREHGKGTRREMRDFEKRIAGPRAGPSAWSESGDDCVRRTSD